MNTGNFRKQLKLYFIMGSINCLKPPEKVLQEAIDGGITMFQFREKGAGALTGSDKQLLAAALQKQCQQKKIPFIVNDDVPVAITLQADGIHIGQEDESARTVRKWIGLEKILGVSVHSVEEAQQAIRDGADYLGVGPIFPTVTKKDAREVTGTRLLQELREHGITMPIVGIGGITAENAAAVIQAGADGISVISAITHAADIREAAAQLVRVPSKVE